MYVFLMKTEVKAVSPFLMEGIVRIRKIIVGKASSRVFNFISAIFRQSRFRKIISLAYMKFYLPQLRSDLHSVLGASDFEFVAFYH